MGLAVVGPSIIKLTTWWCSVWGLTLYQGLVFGLFQFIFVSYFSIIALLVFVILKWNQNKKIIDQNKNIISNTKV